MRCFICIVALGLTVGTVSRTFGQDKQTTTNTTTGSVKEEPKTKLKGTLPANFGKLNLSDAQKQQIYRLQAEYAEKLDKLEKQIEKTRAERNEGYRNVLTKAQRDRLDEIRRGTKEEPKGK